MTLNSNLNHIQENEIIYIPYEDELFSNIINFRYSDYTINALYDMCKDNQFLDRLFNWSCEKMGLDIDELKFYFQNNFDSSTSESLNKLIENQFHRIKIITISFLFEWLPFNYLIKVSEKRRSIDKLFIDLREDLLLLIMDEVKKIENMNKTLETIRENLQQKEQLKKFSSLHNASMSVSRKTQLENMYMYSIIDTIPLESLNSIITQMLDDDLVYNNLYLK